MQILMFPSILGLLMADDLQVNADKITISAEKISAIGNVTVHFGEYRVNAAEMVLLGDVLTAKAGEFVSADGVVQFEDLSFDTQTNFVHATKFSWTKCQCENPLWYIRGEEVLLDASTAHFKGGQVVLLDIPIVPVPNRVPQNEVLLPRVGWAQHGPTVAIPFAGITDVGKWKVEPQVWWGQGVISNLQVASHPFDLQATGGYDVVERTFRGGYRYTDLRSNQALLYSIDAYGWSDPDFSTDYSSTLVPVPHGENRMWLQTGAWQLMSNLFSGYEHLE